MVRLPLLPAATAAGLLLALVPGRADAHVKWFVDPAPYPLRTDLILSARTLLVVRRLGPALLGGRRRRGARRRSHRGQRRPHPTLVPHPAAPLVGPRGRGPARPSRPLADRPRARREDLEPRPRRRLPGRPS